jgi:lipid II:glycine glycyltransferase (peptidoglycan interpeptide bridge formation enzyme)
MNRQKHNKVALHPLQTWEWGEFRKKWGNEIIRTSYGQLTLHKLPLFPHKIGMFIKGPVPTSKILNNLKELSKKEKLIFIKLEPNVSKNEESIKLLKQNGAVPGKTLFTPTSFWIDLTINEEDLLKSFQSKTRYNIRLAQRKGVEVREDNSDKAFEKYIKLTKETVERQGFYAHSEKYHRLMWKTLHSDIIQEGEKPIARLLTAHYKGEIITTWIVFVWKDFLYYPYGASANKHKNVMANNLVMWEAIKYGKKLGLKTFDLWGREPGKGFTRFKEGYRPKVIEFLGTWDLVTSPLYYLYRIAETLRWALLRSRTKLSFARPKF